MNSKWIIKLFVYTAGGILLFAALVRFATAAGDAQSLAIPEPMLGIPLRYSVLLVGGIELAVACVCLFGKQVGLQAVCLAWLSTDFIVYRVALLLMHCHPQGTCLGSLTDPFRLAGGTTGLTIEFMPYYLVLGSYAAATWLFLSGIMSRPPAFMKMFCPGCGGKIQFASQNLGRKIPCPLCRKTITLVRPGLLKMSCSFCNDHIEFPPHAIGQKISCPHCNMAGILKETA